MTVQLIQGDCLDVMKGMEAGSIDLTVTSPPYDNLRAYNGFTFDFEGIAQQLYRVTKSGGVVVWVVGDATIKGSETGTSFKQALYFKEIGFNLHDTMIYKKANILPRDPRIPRYYQEFEYMFVLGKGKPKTCKLDTDTEPDALLLVNQPMRRNAQSQKNCAASVATARYNPLTRRLGIPKNIPTKVAKTPPESSASISGMPSTRI